jgi:short-subunit dehydrogenase
MDRDFKQHYGPWAVVSGASEGTGRTLAREIAARGIPSILIARRQAPLTALVDEIRRETGIECVAATIDLSQPDAFDRLREVVDGREIGLFVSNAGADPNGSHFLDRDVQTWLQLVNRNLLTGLRCCHYFGGLMRERRRGGLLLVGSGAAYGGGSFMATYSGAKAFDLCFSESLWEELRPFDVDVLHMLLTTTDTPEFRRLLAEKGKRPPRGLADPAAVARIGLNHLQRGPLYNWGQRFGVRAGWRRLRVKIVSNFARKMVFGERGTQGPIP